MNRKEYCVYILTNSRHTVLYTGVTNDLKRRVLEHKAKTGSAFTKRYNVDKLVYFEVGDDVNKAIYREKQIKAGSRQKKIDLINGFNPNGKICLLIYLLDCHCERSDTCTARKCR